MIAIEFVIDNDSTKPNAEICDTIVKECSKSGLIVLSAGTHKNIIRILSPLVITHEQLQKGLLILENEIKKAAIHQRAS